MKDTIIQKLEILAESAKYDVSCASSGTTRKNQPGTIGSTNGWGICHSFTEDGRCVSLLKTLFTNYCIYDCAYCINRKTNDIPRTAFTIDELITLTIEFYRRNYIEGLFLSSGVIKSPDHTMERMIRVLKELRHTHHFNGYIHLKAIPGASQELIHQAGLYADRMSVNLEIPTESNLKLLAPEKNHQSVYRPMHFMQQGILDYQQTRKKYRPRTAAPLPRFIPAGQSTQLIIGATNETDRDILNLTSALYQRSSMKRVYYSGYIHLNQGDPRLPALTTLNASTPQRRENRLYQADWLMRFYHFSADEIIDGPSPDLDLDIDPKLAWALRHPEHFPVDINHAPYTQILRIPGVGVKSANLIIKARRHRIIRHEHLKQIGIVLKRAQYFIHCPGAPISIKSTIKPEYIRLALTEKQPHINQSVRLIPKPSSAPPHQQLSFF